MMQVCQEESKIENTKKISLRYCVEQCKICGNKKNALEQVQTQQDK